MIIRCEKHFDHHSVVRVKTFAPKHSFLQICFDHPGCGCASRELPRRNVDSRPKTRLNGAEAPFLSCPETQSWCVIKQEAQHLVRAVPEKRDHTQEHQRVLQNQVFSKIFYS